MGYPGKVLVPRYLVRLPLKSQQQENPRNLFKSMLQPSKIVFKELLKISVLKETKLTAEHFYSFFREPFMGRK